VLAGGANNQCNIYSRDGVQLGVVGELSSWVWSAEVRPDANCVVCPLLSLVAAAVVVVVVVVVVVAAAAIIVVVAVVVLVNCRRGSGLPRSNLTPAVMFRCPLLSLVVAMCLCWCQCFDAVGWAAGRASGL